VSFATKLLLHIQRLVVSKIVLQFWNPYGVGAKPQGLKKFISPLDIFVFLIYNIKEALIHIT
jgi:hypothetical protein